MMNTNLKRFCSKWGWHLSQICISLLMVDATIVFFGIASGCNMWLWIVAYWFILVIKNFIDYLKGLCEHE